MGPRSQDGGAPKLAERSRPFRIRIWTNTANGTISQCGNEFRGPEPPGLGLARQAPDHVSRLRKRLSSVRLAAPKSTSELCEADSGHASGEPPPDFWPNFPSPLVDAHRTMSTELAPRTCPSCAQVCAPGRCP